MFGSNVFSGIEIGVMLESASLALKPGLSFAVCLFSLATRRTSLTRVTGIDVADLPSIHAALVRKVELQALHKLHAWMRRRTFFRAFTRVRMSVRSSKTNKVPGWPD